LIFDTNIAIALKNSNGEYKIEELTIFQIESMNARFSSLNVEIYKTNEIVIKVKCPLCGEVHSYHYNINYD